MKETIIEKIKRRQYAPCYPHFDGIVSLRDVIDNISDPDFIKTHSFKPFLHFDKKTKIILFLFSSYLRSEMSVLF